MKYHQPGGQQCIEEKASDKKRGFLSPTVMGVIALIVAFLGCGLIAVVILFRTVWLGAEEQQEEAVVEVITPVGTTAAVESTSPTLEPSSPPLPTATIQIAYVGQTLSDPAADVFASYIDIVSFSSSRDGEMLECVFTLRDLPETITVNRPGVKQNWWEYSWEALVDIEGDGVNAYSIVAFYLVEDAENTTEKPFGESFTLSVLKIENPTTSVVVSENVDFSFDTTANTITLKATIPLLTDNSLVSFRVTDINDYTGPEVWD